MPHAYWDELTREELNDRAETAVPVLPVGSTEQHAQHLPTKTDVFVANALAEMACRQLPDDVTGVLMPPLPYGYSAHHVPFGGTLTIGADTLSAVLTDLVTSVVGAGFDRMLLVNGHGGNVEICAAVAKRTAIELDALVAAVSYWQLLPAGPGIPGHAGEFETSLMLALAPERVRQSAGTASGGGLLSLPHGGVVEDPRNWASMNGHTDDPSFATAEQGRDYLDRASAALTDTIVALGKMSRPAHPSRSNQ